LLALALTANKFSQRPSALLGLRDETVALDFDIAAAFRLHEFEAENTRALFGTTDSAPDIQWETMPA